MNTQIARMTPEVARLVADRRREARDRAAAAAATRKALTAHVTVRRDGTVVVGDNAVGTVHREWMPSWLWVARNPEGERVGLGVTRREAVEELLGIKP